MHGLLSWLGSKVTAETDGQPKPCSKVVGLLFLKIKRLCSSQKPKLHVALSVLVKPTSDCDAASSKDAIPPCDGVSPDSPIPRRRSGY